MHIQPKPVPCYPGHDEASLPKISVPIDLAVEAVKKHSREIDLTNPGPAVDAIFRNARVIGLGEGSHGTAECFQTQAEITKYLIRERDARLVMVELPPGLAEVMNMTISQSGDNTIPKQVEDTIRKLPFETWLSQEFEDLFLFIREWNLTSPSDPVVFRGIDMSSYNATNALDQMPDASLETRNLARRLEREMNCFPGGLPIKSESVASSDQLNGLKRIWKEAKQHLLTLEEHPHVYCVFRSIAQVAYLNRCTIAKPDSLVAERDKMMAKNVVKEIRRLDPDARAVVLAHNAHVSFDDPFTSSYSGGLGRFLRAYFGEDHYRVLITTSGGGSVTSRVGLTKPSETNEGEVVFTGAMSRERGIYVSDAPLQGSFEDLLSKSVSTPVCLSIESMLKDERLAEVALSPISLRSMGCALLKNEFAASRLASSCDGVVYFPKSNGSKLY